ncbi:hypothetical protein ZWY2020_025901 [Hordeum vulgare]|nr:hypothetical protein ZWY2020_025901 [Hordeum vulgare]
MDTNPASGRWINTGTSRLWVDRHSIQLIPLPCYPGTTNPGRAGDQSHGAQRNNTVANVHSGIDSTNKTLLKSDALYTYILDTTVFPREHECMRDLRLITDKHPWGYMQSSSDEAQLLGMLIKMAGAKKTIEVGVFTGYSLLATALALPEDGKIVAIDTDRECYEVGRLHREGRHGAQVDFREGTGLERLEELLAEDDGAASYDFAFVDADKPNYVRYHEQLLRLVRVGGTIIYDNTLWGGTVALPAGTPLSDLDTRFSAALRDLNAKLAADPRIEVCQLAIADGVTICRRVV